MDDAALRVKASGLKALVRLRATRERQALRELQTSLALKATADAARNAAEQGLVREVATRREREVRLYASLPRQAPVTAGTIEGHRTALARWTETVEQAAAHLGEAQGRLEEAEVAVQEARSHYTARARAARKWAQIETRIHGARHRHAEAAGERDTEDDVMSRRSGAGSTRSRP